MSGEIRSRKKNKQKSKRKASSQSVQDYEDELLSGSPEVPEDEDDESKYYTAHVDEAAEFEEEDEDQGTGCLYKIVFVFLLIILGGIATIVLVDDTQVSGSNHESVSHGEVHLGEQGAHGVEEGGVIVEDEPMLGSIDVSEFVERVLNSFRLEDMFSEPGHEHEEAHEGEEEEADDEEHADGHDDEEHGDEGDHEQDDEDQGNDDEDDQDQTEVGENDDDEHDDQAVGDDKEDANEEEQQDTNEDEDEEQQVPAPVEVEAPVLEEETQEEDQVEEPVQVPVQQPEEPQEAFYNPPTYDQVAPEPVYEEPEEEEVEELPSPIEDEILDEEPPRSFVYSPSPELAQQEEYRAPSESEYAYSYREETPARLSGEDVYTDFQQV